MGSDISSTDQSPDKPMPKTTVNLWRTQARKMIKLVANMNEWEALECNDRANDATQSLKTIINNLEPLGLTWMRHWMP